MALSDQLAIAVRQATIGGDIITIFIGTACVLVCWSVGRLSTTVSLLSCRLWQHQHIVI
jgi:hypothetical protein